MTGYTIDRMKELGGTIIGENINIWGEDNEDQNPFCLSVDQFNEVLEYSMTPKTIKDTLECDFVETEGFIGMTAETTFTRFRNYCEDVFNFPSDKTMNLGVCDLVFEYTFLYILEKHNLDITLKGREPSKPMIETNAIDELLVKYDEFNYILVDREEEIDSLMGLFSEAKSESDKMLMKEDIKYLMSISDNFVFSSISTNEFISFDDNPGVYNCICSSLFAMSISILPELEEDMIFYALMDTDNAKKVRYCAAGIVENESFTGIITLGENGSCFVRDHKSIPVEFGYGEIIEVEQFEEMLNISQGEENFSLKCNRVIKTFTEFVDGEANTNNYSEMQLLPQFISEVRADELKIGKSVFHPIDCGDVVFRGGTRNSYSSYQEFAEIYFDFEKLAKKELEKVLFEDENGKLDGLEAIKIAVANLEGNLAISEVLDTKYVHDYLLLIVNEIEKRNEDTSDSINNTNIAECEVCSVCSVPMLPDDECYCDGDSDKALCSNCSYFCDSCGNYFTENNIHETMEGNWCFDCNDFLKYPLSVVNKVINEGSDLVIDTIIDSGQEIDLENFILSFSTEKEVVFASKERIQKSIKQLDTETVRTFTAEWSISEDINDTEGLMNDITMTVMKQLSKEAKSYFYTLSDYIQEVLVDQCIAIKAELKIDELVNTKKFIQDASNAKNRREKLSVIAKTQKKDEAFELSHHVAAMNDLEFENWFFKSCMNTISNSL